MTVGVKIPITSVGLTPTCEKTGGKTVLHPEPSTKMLSMPPLIRACSKVRRRYALFPRLDRDAMFRWMVLVLTFLGYTTYHLSRRPFSVVKSQLNRDCSGLTPPPGTPPSENATWCDWAPFDGPDANSLLGALDSSYLFPYAAGMFISGYIAERVNLRYYLFGGMVASGIFTIFMGLGKTFNIHSMAYFVIFQALTGLAESTGWPSVVTAVANWFGKGRRGLIFGIWNSHTSIGNILGSLLAGAFVETDWALSFVVPGLCIMFMGVVTFLMLPPRPEDVGCNPPLLQQLQEERTDSVITDSSSQSLREGPRGPKAVGVFAALKIPGVVEFSLCLFFAKLVSYTFLYWLPDYIAESSSSGAQDSANLSTLFDVGGIIGGILAGVISDATGCSALTCVGMLVGSIPALLCYWQWGTLSIGLSETLLIIAGLLVNGPYALITTAVSAELGVHPQLRGSQKALATVTAIIDGTGSIGAAVGPLIAGVVSSYSWSYIFVMLMVADVLALLLLSRLCVKEIKGLRLRKAPRPPTTIERPLETISSSTV